MRFSFLAITLTSSVCALDEAEQSVLLQTKQSVEKREQQDGLPPNLAMPLSLGDAEIVGTNQDRIRNIPECSELQAQVLCPVQACPANSGPSTEPCTTTRGAFTVNSQLCMGGCSMCPCGPPIVIEPPIEITEAPEPQIAFGRPFSTAEGNLVSATKWESDVQSEWIPKDWDHVKLSLPSEVAKFGEAHWREAGEHEHASVASFSRASLDLMRFGAPPDLLRDTHVAAMEEVRHAEISFGLATTFNTDSNASLVVSAFPLEHAELSASLDEFASKLLLEGCIGETSAVARMSHAISRMNRQSPAYDHLVTLRNEEAGHAALAWRSLAWAVSKGAKLPQLPESKVLEKHELSDAETQALSWTGAVPCALRDEIDNSILVSTVVPWVAAIRNGEVHLPDVSVDAVPSFLSDAVVTATGRIHNRIGEVHI